MLTREIHRPDLDALDKWCKANNPSLRMVYREAFWQQVNLFRTSFLAALFKRPHSRKDPIAYDRCDLDIIGTHTSKSILLPVCRFSLQKDDLDVEIILSNNFHDWSVAVNSSHPIPEMVVALRLFDHIEVRRCFLNGIPTEYLYGSYNDDSNQFSCTMHDDYSMWSFLRIIGSMFQ